MEKLLAILGMAALVMTATTGCDIDANLESNGRQMVIDDIYIEPNGWKAALTGDGFLDYYYSDIELPEISGKVFDMDDYHTYWRYGEERGGQTVDVQEPLPAIMNLDRRENGMIIRYTETISCSYEVGWMRIMISRSDSFDLRPDKTLYFRTVINY